MIRSFGDSVMSTDFLIEVARGNVAGYSFISKFGENPSIDTTSDPEDVWDGGGIYTFSSTNDIDSISSSNDTDTQDIMVFGLDVNYREISETVTLTGQTRKALAKTYLRVHRMANVGATDIAGVVYCYVNGAITDGVPDTATDIRAIINNGNNQTLMCVYTIPAGKTGYFLQGYVAIARTITSVATMSWRARAFGGVFAVQSRLSISSAASGSWQYRYGIPIPAPEKTDIKITCETVTTNSTSISGGFEILLIDN